MIFFLVISERDRKKRTRSENDSLKITRFSKNPKTGQHSEKFLSTRLSQIEIVVLYLTSLCQKAPERKMSK